MKRETVRAIKVIGRILKMNRMDTVPPGEERKVPNPLWSVWIHDDEIKDMCKGRIPEDWEETP